MRRSIYRNALRALLLLVAFGANYAKPVIAQQGECKNCRWCIDGGGQFVHCCAQFDEIGSTGCYADDGSCEEFGPPCLPS